MNLLYRKKRVEIKKEENFDQIETFRDLSGEKKNKEQ